MSDDHDQQEEKPRTEIYRLPPDAPFWSEPENDDFSIVQLANVLIRHRWRVLGTPLILAMLLVGGTLLWPDSYTTEASFMSQTSQGTTGQLSQIAGMASQFGVNVPMGEVGQTPQFYSDLVTSPRILQETVTGSYTITAEGDTVHGSLVHIYGFRERRAPLDPTGLEVPPSGEDLKKATDRLRANISVSSNPETGVVELSVTAPWPELSRQIADRLIAGVNEFNLHVRQSQASEQVQFIGERLREARRELRRAEDSLENFLERNVSWRQSPELTFRHDRLQQQVNLKEQVYTSLASRYEEARINEVRNTPVITEVTPPRRPARPDSGRLPLKAAVGLLVGAMIGVLWALGREFAERLEEENSEEYREFVALKEDTAGDLRSARRRIRRMLGGGRDDESR